MNAADADERLTNLFEVHYPEVLAYCTRRIGPGEGADAASEVFAIAWRRVDEIDWETARPWLYAIARNVVSNRWRSLRRLGRLRERISSVPVAQVETPEIYLLRREEDREVIEALSKLKESDREILRLSAWEELTSAEIAVVLGISRSATEQRLHRAKGRFARVLQRDSTRSQLSPRAVEERGGPT